jgi:high-affinity iron transporter
MAIRWLARWLGSGLVLLAFSGLARADVSPQGQEGLRQIAGILDYIAGDFRGAVSPSGQVLDAAELNEQRSLAKDADALAEQAGLGDADPLRTSLREIARALGEGSSPDRVTELCRAAREQIVRAYAVDLAPRGVPSRLAAMKAYRAQGCDGCHGADGSGNTPAAATLTPRPANFLDPQRVATVSPQRAFSAITFGVPGTAMKGYKPALDDTLRWSLAFYVLSLRHLSADLAAGKRVFERAHAPAPTSAKELSALTEEDLTAKLAVIENLDDRRLALAYLRAQAPFEQRDDARSLAVAYEKLAQALDAYRKGDKPAARQLLVSAYLDGFEPHEASLRARNAALVAEVEKAMLGLRTAAAEGVSVDELEQRAAVARTLLARAESQRSDPSTAFFGALAITLREGLEIALLVAALLALVRKRGHPELAKFVHAGWLAAIPAGLGTFWLVGSVFGGMQRELAEGVASVLAAVVLLGVTHWLLGQLGARPWVGFLARRVGEAASSRSAAVGVLSLAFIAAYREAFEVVLFFQALVLDAADAVRDVWLGACAGLLLLSVVAVGMLRVGRRLKPAPFMLASSVFLALLSLVLIGKGVRAFQEAGVLSIHALNWPELPLLGVFGTAEGMVGQGVLLLLLLSSAIGPWLHARKAASSQPVTSER